jgi:hypothetical protein
MTSLLKPARRCAGRSALTGLVCWLAVGVFPHVAHAADEPQASDPPGGIALVKRVAGQVQLWRGGVGQSLKEGQRLASSDLVQTGADGAAALVFRDGTRLTVGHSSELQLRRYAFAPKADGCDGCAFDIYLAKGRAVYASGKIGKLAPQSVQLETPNAIAGVRGTRLILEVQ